MTWSEMSEDERYYFALRVQKAINAEVDSMKARHKERIKKKYLVEGTQSSEARLFGKKVGTDSAVIKKGKDETVLKETDHESLYAWAEENGYILTKIDMESIQENFRLTGEVPPGTEPVHVHTEDEFSYAKTQIDPRKVDAALGPQLGQAVVGLLQGGGAE